MRRSATLLGVIAVVAACSSTGGPDSSTTVPPASVAPATTTTTSPAAAQYVADFEFVWATINDEFYDAEFRGIDWQAAHDRYLPQVAAAADDDAFLTVVNTMLGEFDVSHLAVLPTGEEELLDPVLSAEGELGLDVRMLAGEWVITSVTAGSPAAAAGLRPGYVLESIGGQDIADIAAAAHPLPPSHERGVRSNWIRAVTTELYGAPGADVAVGYRDGGDAPSQATLTCAPRSGDWQRDEVAGVAMFSTMESRRLDTGIGYLTFNAFLPGVLPSLLGAVDELADAPGLIIDLRGNHGGEFPVRKALVDKLIAEPMRVWTYDRRGAVQVVHASPDEPTYDGPLVVMTDVLSASAAEEFSGALQALARAVVIGERTAGRVLVADFAQLPGGSLMMYPYAETAVADGTVLENRGVIPDIAVELTRDDLLAGVDTQLEAAVEYLLSLDA